MNTNIDSDDYWTLQQVEPPAPSTTFLAVQTIEGIEPLDEQFGVTVPKTIPDALSHAFFGEDEAKSPFDQNPAPLHTYAILDAAKVTGLPELLEASELEHRCLFKGEAFDALKDVAPWVVKMEEASSFTRNVFTLSDASWHMWAKEPGIYIRSRGTLNDIWAHFRKLTRVRDEQGNWFYFRFWEAGVSALFFGGNPNSVQETGAKFGDAVIRIMCHSKKGCLTVIEPSASHLPIVSGLPANFLACYLPIFEQHRWGQFVDRFAPKMVETLISLNQMMSEEDIRKLCDQARAEDFHFEDEIEEFILDVARKMPKQPEGESF